MGDIWADEVKQALTFRDSEPRLRTKTPNQVNSKMALCGAIGSDLKLPCKGRVVSAAVARAQAAEDDGQPGEQGEEGEEMPCGRIELSDDAGEGRATFAKLRLDSAAVPAFWAEVDMSAVFRRAPAPQVVDVGSELVSGKLLADGEARAGSMQAVITTSNGACSLELSHTGAGDFKLAVDLLPLLPQLGCRLPFLE